MLYLIWYSYGNEVQDAHKGADPVGNLVAIQAKLQTKLEPLHKAIRDGKPQEERFEYPGTTERDQAIRDCAITVAQLIALGGAEGARVDPSKAHQDAKAAVPGLGEADWCGAFAFMELQKGGLILPSSVLGTNPLIWTGPEKQGLGIDEFCEYRPELEVKIGDTWKKLLDYHRERGSMRKFQVLPASGTDFDQDTKSFEGGSARRGQIASLDDLDVQPGDLVMIDRAKGTFGDHIAMCRAYDKATRKLWTIGGNEGAAHPVNVSGAWELDKNPAPSRVDADGKKSRVYAIARLSLVDYEPHTYRKTGAAGPAERAASAVGASGPSASGAQPALARRAVSGSARIELQRDTVQAGFQWPTDPQTVNSPFPIKVLVDWLHVNPVTALDIEFESAYDRSKVEPDPLGCSWKGHPSNVKTVADAFLSESSAAGFSFRTDDVVATIRDQVARLKRARLDDVTFMPRSAWDAPEDKWDRGLPWQAYDDNTDQFSSGGPDPMKGPAGPIVDWLDWYEFDAPWPPSNDGDACRLHAQGATEGARVMGVVRLYHNEAIRAGYLGVDHQTVEAFVRNDLQIRKQKKQAGDLARISNWDGRGIRDDRRASAFGTATKAPAPKPREDPGDLQIQFQGNFARHTPVGGGTATNDPLTAQITVSDIIFHLPVPGTKKGGEFQISLQGSASFALANSPGATPQLSQANLSNVQGAAQGAWAKDLFTDLLQVQVFVQAVGGANISQTPTAQSGAMRFKAERMGQAVLGTQLAFTVPGTGKHVQIFLQGQVSRTDAPSGQTNDQQFSFGVSYAP
jgi:hypothetical protein